MDDPKQTSGTFEQGPAGVGAFSSLLLAPQERVVAHAEDQLDDVQTEHAENTLLRVLGSTSGSSLPPGCSSASV
jgi:hypothetical protein